MATSRTLVDPYRELGVPRGATRDEIVAAFRAQAKALHPDARPGDAEAAARFQRVGEAYRLLSDPVERARYDHDAARRPASSWPVATPAPAVTTSGPRRGFRLSRRGARWAVAGGAALVALGVAAGAFVFSLQRHDADLRARGVATRAIVVEVGGDRKLEFTTRDGRLVRASEAVKSGVEQPPVGARIAIHYDRSDPTNVVTDDSHLARNLTLWIVAVKFAVGGAVLLWFGIRRLRLPELPIPA